MFRAGAVSGMFRGRLKCGNVRAFPESRKLESPDWSKLKEHLFCKNVSVGSYKVQVKAQRYYDWKKIAPGSACLLSAVVRFTWERAGSCRGRRAD